MKINEVGKPNTSDVEHRYRPDLEAIIETGRQLGIGRTKTYELLNSGEIDSVKIGSRRLVIRTSREKYVQRLADLESGKAS